MTPFAFARDSTEGIWICPHIQVFEGQDGDSLDLSEDEIRLMCGDTHTDRVGNAWKSVPPIQAQALFRTFIQDRGYYEPRFEKLPDGKMAFYPGSRSQVSAVTGPTLPSELYVEGYRRPRRQVMTPKLLDEIQSWASRRLKELGHPCPDVGIKADPRSGAVTLTWKNPDAPADVKGVQDDPVPGVIPRLLSRNDAFHLGGPYSLVTTELSERRSTQDRVVTARDLMPVCHSYSPATKWVDLRESVQAGLPRFVRFGISANTEVGPMAYSSWSHNRLGKSGSLTELSGRASFREQTGQIRGHWYYVSHYSGQPSPQRISPSILFAHQTEPRYEILAFRASAGWETQFETGNGHWSFGITPGWSNLQQVQGVGPLNSQFFTLRLQAAYLSHWFEYLSDRPEKGFRVSGFATAVPTSVENVGRLGSFGFQGTWLRGIGKVDPPWAVFGVRTKIFTTWKNPAAEVADVPVDFRYWVGGGDDVRGFARKELPNDDVGVLAGITVGTELRFPYSLPWGIEPLLLTDFAKIENRAFWSPGFGLRAGTPIGTVRATLAHGFEVGGSDRDVSHLQFYIGVGEEF